MEGDAGDGDAVAEAMDGAVAAYYLVHSMGGAADFAGPRPRWPRRRSETPPTARLASSRSCTSAGSATTGTPSCRRTSASRHEVGRVLAAGSVPVTELRAAVIIGSGSASFEMLRNLTDVLPVMITPRWVSTRCQPVAIRDILHWLVRSISTPEARGRVLEVGGPEVVTYEDMMRAYAEVAGSGSAWWSGCRSSRPACRRTGSASSPRSRWAWPAR